MLKFISEHTLIILLSLGTGFNFFWLYRHMKQLRMNYIAVFLLSVLHTVAGVLSVKVFAVLETLDLSKAGAMSLFGGIFFLPIVYYIGAKISKREVAKVFDTFTPCMIFTVMCARINCILSGCCKGQCISGLGEIRWPTRQLEVIFYIVLLSYFWKKDISVDKEKQEGLYYPIYMIAYGALRFLIEGFRESSSPTIIHVSHLWALLTFCLGLSIYIELKKKKRRKKVC